MTEVALCPRCRKMTLDVVVREDGTLGIYCLSCRSSFRLAYDGRGLL